VALSRHATTGTAEAVVERAVRGRAETSAAAAIEKKSRRIRLTSGVAVTVQGPVIKQEGVRVTGLDPLQSYSVEDLCSRCREQILRFRRNEPTDDRFCLEVFRRAIHEQDQECWAQLQQIYQTQVAAWCRRASASYQVSAEDLIALTWERFWSSFGPAKFDQAENTASVQRYLKACAFSAAIDAAREQARTISLDQPRLTRSGDTSPLGDSLMDTTQTAEERITDEAARRSLWEIVEKHLSNEQERTFVYLKYELGLKSADIQSRRPDLFPSVNDVYRTTRNLLDRLRRSPELMAWLGGGDG
jgi:RNA polymerase sigma factor (sigma-70 family)